MSCKPLAKDLSGEAWLLGHLWVKRSRRSMKDVLLTWQHRCLERNDKDTRRQELWRPYLKMSRCHVSFLFFWDADILTERHQRHQVLKGILSWLGRPNPKMSRDVPNNPVKGYQDVKFSSPSPNDIGMDFLMAFFVVESKLGHSQLWRR